VRDLVGLKARRNFDGVVAIGEIAVGVVLRVVRLRDDARLCLRLVGASSHEAKLGPAGSSRSLFRSSPSLHGAVLHVGFPSKSRRR